MVPPRIRGDDELRLIRGLVGYTSSIAATGMVGDLAGALLREVPAARRYLISRGTSFPSLVQAKRLKRLEILAEAR